MEKELGFDPRVDAAHISVRNIGGDVTVPYGSDATAQVKDGVITLSGHVRIWAEHDAVLDAAWMAQSVIEVRDDLQITGCPDRPAVALLDTTSFL